jgi:hypothetical protein
MRAIWGESLDRFRRSHHGGFLSDVWSEYGPENVTHPEAAEVLPFFLFTLFDQLPEASVLLQLFIFCHRQFGAKKEIPNGIFVQDSMDQDSFLTAFEVNSVVIGSVPIKTFSFALDDAEGLGIETIQVVGQKLEFSQQLQLKFLGDSGHFSRTNFVENDLIHRVSSRFLLE